MKNTHAVITTLLLAVSTATAHAQQPPYDVFPAAEPPYYRIRYEAADQPELLPYAVNYTVWIPQGVETLRGVIVHQHGCGTGSCKSGLTAAFDLHWQALARKHKCALLGPSYEQPDKADCQMWCDPRNGSDSTFRKALADLGEASGHPELAKVPWALWGHSGGGHWAGGMVMLYPERIAAAWLRSGVPLFEQNPERLSIKAHTLPDAALQVPIMCNPGTKEGVTITDGRFASVWPANVTFFQAIRSKGGLIGISIDPLTAHECGNQRYLAIRWLDSCLSTRLPDSLGEPLKPMPTTNAWVAPLKSTTAIAESDYDGDQKTAIWLPSEAIAKLWMEYVKDTKVADTTLPPSPKNLQLNGNTLKWDAFADLESGLAHFIIERDGTPYATVPQNAKNPFGRPIFQGLQYSDTPIQPLAEMKFVEMKFVEMKFVEMKFVDSKSRPNAAHSYRVIAVNTVGLTSVPSKNVTVK